MDKLYCKLDELAKLECKLDELDKLKMSWISSVAGYGFGSPGISTTDVVIGLFYICK